MNDAGAIHSMSNLNVSTNPTPQDQPRYFIPIFGSYYHFLNESVLGLYNMLREERILDTLECQLWYQGSYNEIVQMFSRNPIVKIPVVKPYLKNASTLGSDIKLLKQVRLGRNAGFDKLLPLVEFFNERVPVEKAEFGITVINRVKKRVCLETEEIANRLGQYGIPVRLIQMEAQSFARQINVMRNTLILIAPHGAGTMNQIFMPRGGHIFELFPKGYSNWHAKAVADAFGHCLTEIESEVPGTFGRQPTAQIIDQIEGNGWPDRATVRASRKQSEDLHRVIRDVATYSIDPDRVVSKVGSALTQFKIK